MVHMKLLRLIFFEKIQKKIKMLSTVVVIYALRIKVLLTLVMLIKLGSDTHF